MKPTLTYARILRVVSQGEDRFFDIAVQLPTGGEWNAGLIKDTGFVLAEGLVVGMWAADRFMPFGGVTNTGGGGTLIRGEVIEIEGLSIGPQSELSYVVQWDTGETRIRTRARNMYPDELVHRIAFPVGSIVYGQEVTDDNGDVTIEIVDREDYAVGCDA